MRRSPISIILLSLLWVLASGAEGGSGRVNCEILENGEAGSGTLEILDGDKQVFSGSCGQDIAIAPGSYTAVLALDGALDGPQSTQSLVVEAGKPASVRADFPTGILEVRIQSKGRPAAGMAIIRRDGRQIGTLGSGVAAHVSAGTYQVEARHRKQKKPFDNVKIRKGERVVLNAAFE